MQCVTKLVAISSRQYHFSATCFAGSKWRLERGLAKYGNEYGPLTDIPDWSYADGRPSPMQPGEKNRRERHKVFAEKALSLMEEMNDSRKIHKAKQQATIDAREKLLKQKLKPNHIDR